MLFRSPTFRTCPACHLRYHTREWHLHVAVCILADDNLRLQARTEQQQYIAAELERLRLEHEARMAAAAAANPPIPISSASSETTEVESVPDDDNVADQAAVDLPQQAAQPNQPPPPAAEEAQQPAAAEEHEPAVAAGADAPQPDEDWIQINPNQDEYHKFVMLSDTESTGPSINISPDTTDFEADVDD